VFLCDPACSGEGKEELHEKLVCQQHRKFNTASYDVVQKGGSEEGLAFLGGKKEVPQISSAELHLPEISAASLKLKRKEKEKRDKTNIYYSLEKRNISPAPQN